LREAHAKKLIPARKRLEFVIAVIAFDTTSKTLGRKKVHQLCKDRFARIHQPSAAANVAHAAAGLVLISNRSLCALGLTFSLSITYRQWANKRWDGTDSKSEICLLSFKACLKVFTRKFRESKIVNLKSKSKIQHHRMPVEIEKKYRLTKKQRDAIVRRLRKLGASPGDVEFEENTLYRGGRLELGGVSFRLTPGNRPCVLTFKQPSSPHTSPQPPAPKNT